MAPEGFSARQVCATYQTMFAYDKYLARFSSAAILGLPMLAKV